MSQTARKAEAQTEAEGTRLLQLQFQIVLHTYHITSVTALVGNRMCCDCSHV